MCSTKYYVTKISYYNYFDQIELLKKTNIIIIFFFSNGFARGKRNLFNVFQAVLLKFYT